MSNELGLVKLVVSPFVKRIGHEERLGGENPRSPKNQKQKRPGTDEAPDSTPEETRNSDDSASSPHIDLRI